MQGNKKPRVPIFVGMKAVQNKFASKAMFRVVFGLPGVMSIAAVRFLVCVRVILKLCAFGLNRGLGHSPYFIQVGQVCRFHFN
jgi:hypothetical protein